jgi:protein-disulfide isomerase
VSRLKNVLDAGTVILCLAAATLVVTAVRLRDRNGEPRYAEPRISGLWNSGPTIAAATLDSIYAAEASGLRIGRKDAAVTLVEFTDYACGHCVEFEPTLQRILSRYPDHVSVVVKHFMPAVDRAKLQIDLAAECAGEQGKFAEFHHAYFALLGQTATDYLRAIAGRIGMPDSARFVSCIRSGRFTQHVIRDTEQGLRLGVTGTPTTFVNGLVIPGAISFEALDTIVAGQLNRRPR